METVRDFEIGNAIGNGGMATVFLAKQQSTGKRVALKLMHPHLANDPIFVQRFLQEVKATTGMQHENIVEVVACGEDGGRYYMASEFVDSGTIADLLGKVPKFPASLAADLALQLLMGLGYAHQRGVVHRDIKPANLMLTSAGKLKVGDFGIAKTQGSAALTQTGNLIGTPAYMSPEQAQGQPIDQRSDLFSAGVVFYEMLTGFNPYLGENESTTLLKILKSTPQMVFEVDPTVPASIENILERLLERDPQKRYPNAGEAIDELRPIVEAERAKQPGLVGTFILDPVATKKKLNDAQAALYLWQATERLKAGPGERYQAAMDLYRASLLNPDDLEADTLLKKVCTEQKLNFSEARNPKIKELEGMLETSPDSAGVLMQLASLYRLEGNLYKAVACFKKVLRLRPNDGYVQGQLSILTGEKARAPLTSSRAMSGPATSNPVAPRSFSATTGTSGLHTGHTGEVRPRAPTVNVPMPAADFQPPLRETTGEDSEAMQLAKQIWHSYGNVILVVLVLVGGGWFITRRVGKLIDTSVSETDRATNELLKATAHPTNVDPSVAARQSAALSEKFGEQAAAALRAAQDLEDGGKHQAAHDAFLEVAKGFPKRPQAISAGLAAPKALLAAGQPAAAIAELETFIREHRDASESLEAQVVLAEIYLGINKTAEANGATTQFLIAHDSSAFAGRAHLVRAKSYLVDGNKDDARKDLEWVKGKYPTADPLYRRAVALQEELDGAAAPSPAPGGETAPAPGALAPVAAPSP